MPIIVSPFLPASVVTHKVLGAPVILSMRLPLASFAPISSIFDASYHFDAMAAGGEPCAGLTIQLQTLWEDTS
ncbi:hypothetical protein D3C81_1063280 [compost metagenome]